MEENIGENYAHADIQFDIATIKTKTKTGKISFKVVEGGEIIPKKSFLERNSMSG